MEKKGEKHLALQTVQSPIQKIPKVLPIPKMLMPYLIYQNSTPFLDLVQMLVYSHWAYFFLSELPQYWVILSSLLGREKSHHGLILRLDVHMSQLLFQTINSLRVRECILAILLLIRKTSLVPRQQKISRNTCCCQNLPVNHRAHLLLMNIYLGIAALQCGQCLLHSEVSQLYVPTYPIPLGSPSHPPAPHLSGHRRVWSGSPSAMQQVLTGCLFYAWQCIYISLKLICF